MDKIYSRKSIRIYKFTKIKIVLIFSMIVLILFVFYYANLMYPVFVASCENAAYSSVTRIVTTQIKDVMKNYTYNDLIEIEKDVNGEITFLKVNTILINEIVANLTQKIQSNIDKQERVKVFINMGTITGISALSVVGPKFEIELEAAGDGFIDVISEFENKGINQTIHKIFVDVDAFVKIVTPLGCFEKDIKTKVLLTEAIIVGEVPETYYNLENVATDEAFKY